MNVLLANNYDMEQCLRGWREGEVGRHHLWGVTELGQYGYHYELLPYRVFDRLKPTGYSRWGDMDQELRLWMHRNYDVVYAAADNVVMGLAFLRGLGLFRKPIVCLMHHVPPGGRHSRICLRGIDHILCLSHRVSAQMCSRFPFTKQKLSILEWGWDLDFPAVAEGHGDYILSAGFTLRDYGTLCAALRRVPMQAKIICRQANVPGECAPGNVEITVTDDRWVCERNLREIYREALAVAIPMPKLEVLAGLSSLLEAMANSKAVLITRNPCIDIDVEREGCGIWVEPGDADDWCRALDFVGKNPGEAAAMGARGRSLCEKRYNIKRFGAQLAAALGELK